MGICICIYTGFDFMLARQSAQRRSRKRGLDHDKPDRENAVCSADYGATAPPLIKIDDLDAMAAKQLRARRRRSPHAQASTMAEGHDGSTIAGGHYGSVGAILRRELAATPRAYTAGSREAGTDTRGHHEAIVDWALCGTCGAWKCCGSESACAASITSGRNFQTHARKAQTQVGSIPPCCCKDCGA